VGGLNVRRKHKKRRGKKKNPADKKKQIKTPTKKHTKSLKRSRKDEPRGLKLGIPLRCRLWELEDLRVQHS